MGEWVAVMVMVKVKVAVVRALCRGQAEDGHRLEL